MTAIKYYDGKKVIEIEVADKVAACLKELQREQWRSEKRIKRHYAALSLTRMEEENDSRLTGLSAKGPLERIIEREESAGRMARLSAAVSALTPKQRALVKLLWRGKGVTAIAAEWRTSKAAVARMKKRVQEKLRNILRDGG